MKHFLPLFILTGLLFGQDGLFLKSGEFYKGRYVKKADELIVFQVEGENHFTPFPINDVTIIKTSNWGELTYPFDIPTKQEYHPKFSYKALSPGNKIILGCGACYISSYLFYLLIDATKPGM